MSDEKQMRLFPEAVEAAPKPHCFGILYDGRAKDCKGCDLKDPCSAKQKEGKSRGKGT